MQHHVARKIQSYDPAARKVLQQQLCQSACSATGVENQLVSAEAQFTQDPLAPFELRRGEPMIFRSVPLVGFGEGLRHACGLDRRQSLIQICNDVVHVLDANRNPHHAVRDADFAASFFADRGMGHCGRV